ncbi:MAG: inositol 2-dehydrogenase [Pseudomonadota bacterium]
MALKLALLGAGRIGKAHARAVSANPDATLSAVADAMPASAEALAKQYGCPVATIDEIEEDVSIDGVIICTPTPTHADLIEQFARAGKAIFCEKPIDLDVDRVRQCLVVVEKTGASLMVGFNRRFDPHFASAKTAITDGKIGKVELVQITSRDPAPPPIDYIKVSGGIFRDMMIHDFDMARFLLGEEPVNVFASGSVLVDPAIGEAGDVDTATATLTTASGKQCVITNSRRASYGYDQRIDVHGSLGSVTIDNQRDTSLELATSDGYIRAPLLNFFMERYERAYANEIADFVANVRDGKASSPNGVDGLQSLRIADAAVRSLQEGHSVAI